MNNAIADGDVQTFTAPVGGVVSGSPYFIGSLLVIATGDADEADQFVGVVTGVVDVEKVETEAWTEGLKIGYDDTLSPEPKFTKDSGTIVGVAVSAVPPNLSVQSDADAADLTLAKNVLTVADYAALAGKTITVTVSGVTTVLTEGSGLDFVAETSNNQTATNIAAAIAALDGVYASASSAVVTVQTGVGRVRLDGAAR